MLKKRLDETKKVCSRYSSTVNTSKITAVGRHKLYVSNYRLYCRIRPERLLCDAACDLLAVAKFLVRITERF